jgi:hypothetical protein
MYGSCTDPSLFRHLESIILLSKLANAIEYDGEDSVGTHIAEAKSEQEG